MSGLEREELQARMQGMTREEQAQAAGALPDEVIWNEIHKRFAELRSQVDDIRSRRQEGDRP